MTDNQLHYSICYNLIFVTLLFSITSCSPSARFDAEGEERRNYGRILRGTASYYGAKFHGRKTASGEVFDMYALTAAHNQLPFGTRIKVTSIRNGKSVVVRINDRGPFVRGRIIDLSYRAAAEIDMLNDGTTEVELLILE